MSQSGAYYSWEDSDPYLDPDSDIESQILNDFTPLNLWKLLDLISMDNKDAFVRHTKYERQRPEDHHASYQSQLVLSTVFLYISSTRAVKCATALLAGETGLDVNINALDPELGSTPLLFTYYPAELVDLYIRNGARTDIRLEGMLPLNRAIRCVRNAYKNVDCSSKQSVCMVIVLLFIDLEHLSSTRLLFVNTKEVEKEVYHYVKGGRLLETAVLLMVAREEITSPCFFEGSTSSGSMSLHQLVSLEIESLEGSQTKLDSTSDEIQELGNKLETMTFILYLIEIHRSVGPEIDQYRRDIPKLSMEELVT